MIKIWVTVDYLSVGSDDDYLRFPLSPYAGVLIGSKFDMSLPTRAIVEAIFAQSNTKVYSSPLPAGSTMQGSGYMWYYNQYVTKTLASNKNYWAGALVGGHKKDPIISFYSQTHPKQLDFYGWYKQDGTPWQTNPAHEASYADYSHGIRLVSNTVEVTENGQTQELRYFDLLQNPKYAVIINANDAYAPSTKVFNPTVCYTSCPANSPSSICSQQQNDSWLIALLTKFP